MATRRAALVLCGDGDLGGVARRLHTLAVGHARPFIACGEHETSKIDPTHSGTCCFVDDMAQLGRSTVLELPALDARAQDLERLILDYADDAVTAFEAPSHGFRDHELVWLRSLRFASLEEIEEVTYRLVALRNWSVRGGAQRLGISHVALSRWARRRRIPT